jgi:hypothetical protein
MVLLLLLLEVDVEGGDGVDAMERVDGFFAVANIESVASLDRREPGV